MEEELKKLNACGVFLDRLRELIETADPKTLSKGLFDKLNLKIKAIADETLPIGTTWWVDLHETPDDFTVELNSKMFE